MMSLLFLLFLLVMILTLIDRERLSFFTFGVAMALSTLWLLYHAQSTLSIQL